MTSADKTRLTKQERREAAREEARRLREEQEKRDKRNRLLMIAGVLGIVALAVVAVVAIIINSNRSALDGVNGPANADEHGGFTIGTNLEAGAAGEGVPVNVFLDYTCHFCAQFEDQYADAIKEMASSGEAEFRFHPVAILDGSGDFADYSGLAANASATVAEHAPAQWIDFNTALFGPWADASARAQAGEDVLPPGLPEIEAVAVASGVPQDVVDRFADGEFRQWTEATTRDFISGRAQAGTPEIQVDGEVLNGWSSPNALQDAVAAAAGQ